MNKMNEFPPNPDLVGLAVKVHQAVSTPTYYWKRMEAMGFSLLKVEVYLDGPRLVVQAEFKCVCGTLEMFRHSWSSSELIRMRHRERVLQEFDVALELHHSGSFSQDHLKADGYSQEDIQEILEKGERFDAENGKSTPSDWQYCDAEGRTSHERRSQEMLKGWTGLGDWWKASIDQQR